MLTSERDRQKASLRNRIDKLRALQDKQIADVEQKLTARREQSKRFVAEIKRQASEQLLSARSARNLAMA